MEITLNAYYTLILATLVLLLGRFLTRKIKFLATYNIPEPVAGGLLAGLIVVLIKYFIGVSFIFNSDLQTAFMLLFFSSIGLSADFKRLKVGGMPLVIFSMTVSGLIIVQNVVGVSMATLVGLDPLMGLVTGSITLTGGHGTAAAWGPILEDRYGVVGATTLGVATATFGLVAGGMIGGPVANFLLKKMKREPLPEQENLTPLEEQARKASLYKTQHDEEDDGSMDALFDKPDQIRRLTVSSAIETLALFAACLAFADVMTNVARGSVFELPTFVWALMGGVII
ncbi:MAG: sodium/glutamate symporter, partial [Alcaligenaceae bacterium]|nr:sodium/glutamate symporter [Alcaligenaceae bacterium]